MLHVASLTGALWNIHSVQTNTQLFSWIRVGVAQQNLFFNRKFSPSSTPPTTPWQISSHRQNTEKLQLLKVNTFIKIRKQTFFSACFIPRNSWHFLVIIFLKKIIKIIWLRADTHLGKTHPKLSMCSTVISLGRKKKKAKEKEEVNEVFIRDVIIRMLSGTEWTWAEPILPSRTHWVVFGGRCASQLCSALSGGCPQGSAGQHLSSLSSTELKG